MLSSLVFAYAACVLGVDDAGLAPKTLGAFTVEGGALETLADGTVSLKDTTLASPIDAAGDVTIILTFAQPLAEVKAAMLTLGDLEVGFDAGQATIARGGSRLAAAAAPGKEQEVRIVLRGRAVEVLAHDVSVAFAESPTPFSGGRLTLSAKSARLSAFAVTRRAWFDDVHVEPIRSTKRASLINLPNDRFELAEPLPPRIDPVYVLRVKGELVLPFIARIDPVYAVRLKDERGLRVSFCGVRPDEATVPLIEQALAYAQIQPRIAVRLLLGEKFEKGPLIEGDEPGIVAGTPAYAECDVLVGVLGLPPTASVYDADSGELLDRSWVGGPPARALATRIPDECKGLRFVLVVPGRASLERTVRLKRP